MSAKKPDAITRYEGKRGVRWIARVRVRGYKERQKTFAHEAKARTWEADERKKLLWHKDTKKGRAEWSLGDLVREHLGDANVMAMRSYSDHKRELGWFDVQYGTLRLLDFDATTIHEATKKLLEDGTRTPSTVNRYLAAMRSAWNWAIGKGFIPSSHPWPARTMQDEPPGRTRYLIAEEISRLLKAAADDVDLHAAIVVSIATGVRQGELLRFTWADIDLLRGRAVVQYSKNGRKRSVSLTSSAVEALGGLRPSNVDSSTRVFLAPDGKPLGRWQLIYRWKAIRKAANLTDVHWHDLRHTCASQLAQHGATLLEIGALLGHTSPLMTQRYAHLVEGAKIKGHDKLDAMLATPGQPSCVEQPRDSSGLQFVAIGGYTMSAHVSYSVETTLQPPLSLTGTSQPAPVLSAPQAAQNATQEHIKGLDKLDALLAA
jgi:integrase